jgi:hypothetical protein
MDPRQPLERLMITRAAQGARSKLLKISPFDEAPFHAVRTYSLAE